MACVIHLISHDAASVSRECIGFCKGRQKADIFPSIQTLIQKKKQWGEGHVNCNAMFGARLAALFMKSRRRLSLRTAARPNLF
jgi:hypothetical protein